MDTRNPFDTGAGDTAAQKPTDKAKEALHDMGQQVKHQAQNLKEQAKQAAADTAEQLKERGHSAASRQKDWAADEIGHFSSAMRQAAGKLHDDQEHSAAHYVELLADQVERATNYLRRHSVEDLVQSAGHMVRRRPEIVIGAAFIGGLALARFLKASGRESGDGRWSQQRYGGYGSASGDQGQWGEEFGGRAFTAEHESHLAGGTEPGAVGEWADRTSDVGGLGRTDMNTSTFGKPQSGQ